MQPNSSRVALSAAISRRNISSKMPARKMKRLARSSSISIIRLLLRQLITAQLQLASKKHYSATINDGYELKKLIVTNDRTGEQIEVANLKSFAMIDDDVTVTAIFGVINPGTDDEFETYLKVFFASIMMLQIAYFVKKS